MITAHLRRNITCLFSHSHASFSFSVLHLSSFVTEETKSFKTHTELELLLHEHELSPKVVSRVVSALYIAKRKENLEQCDSTLSYLKDFGFTKSELDRIFNVSPQLLLASVHKTIEPKIKIFQDLGLSSREIASVISKDPVILHASAKNKLIPAILQLKSLLGSSEEVARILRRKERGLFRSDLERCVIPNIEFLQSCGVTKEQVFSFIKSNFIPRYLHSKPETFRKCLAKVYEMGVDRDSRSFLYVVGFVASMSERTWELKLQAFRNILECSHEDICSVFKRCPRMIGTSVNKLKKMKEVLLVTGKYDTLSILQSPHALTYSIEKRHKPRFEVLAILERMGLINNWPHLATLSKTTDAKFFNVFVGPHLENPEILTWYKKHSLKKGDNIS